MSGHRRVVEALFAQAGVNFNVALELDSMSMIVEAVAAGLGVSVQPWSTLERMRDADQRFDLINIADAGAMRVNWLCSLSDSELTAAAAATRGTLKATAADLVESGRWKGARLAVHDS